MKHCTLVVILAAALAAVLFTAPQPATAQAGPPTFSATGTVNRGANLRSGPGTDFGRIGSAAQGQPVTVAACSAACDWYRLDTGAWIAAFLVDLDEGAPATASESGPTLPAGTTPAVVTAITDGDTIGVRIDDNEYRLRYIGMDTPEAGEPCYGEATAANASLVEGTTVYLEKDVSETDRYGRLLRYVWLADGRMVNAELVRQGFAAASTYPPDVKYQERLAVAQRAAMEAGIVCGVTQIAAADAAPTGPTANAVANLRAGPGTNYTRIGSVSAGVALAVVGRNAAGDWLKLGDGAWIAAFLVDGAPGAVPLVEAALVETPSGSGRSVAPVAVEPPSTAPSGNCDPAYPTVCIAAPPPDLDCGEVSFRRFTVLAPDPHRFDGDHDGVGCER